MFEAREAKYLKETNNYTEGIIYNKMRDYIEHQKPELFKESIAKKETGVFIARGVNADERTDGERIQRERSLGYSE